MFQPEVNYFFKATPKFILLLCFLCLAISISSVKAQAQKPNIILILADDVGYKSITCDGGNLYSTPIIDSLAKNGMRFTQCHALPVCSPSRQEILTGKYNFRNYTEWGKMSPNEKTIGNVMRNAGYKTAFIGKDQLDGGGTSLNAWGFDSYCVDAPFKDLPEGSKYKDPSIYTHGNFLLSSLTAGKYGEDIFTDSLFSFIDENKSNPFFIYYPMVLVHKPFCPTPDDEAFANWNPGSPSDTSYFPSMMKYMDKKIGQIINKLKATGIDKNTIIIFTGDNGTPAFVADYADENDSVVIGGKSLTTEAGTHVPLIIYWPGTVAPNSVNNDLIDFSDFLPTITSVTNVSVPASYGPVDGVSFASQIRGQAGTPRSWIFSHYNPNPTKSKSSLMRWAQTTEYKLYDTCASNADRLFYNIVLDPDEINPIPDNLLTPEEAAIKQNLLNVINNYVAQGSALLDDPKIGSFTDSSATILSSITLNGGSTITSSGLVWGTEEHPVLSSPGNHTSENQEAGSFVSLIKSLTSNTTYYIRTYAVNVADTAYSKEIIFTTPLSAPVCTNATAVKNTDFVANWKKVLKADSYKIDVSILPSFASSVLSSQSQGFDNGINQVTGWVFSTKSLSDDYAGYGKSAPSIKFNKNGEITTKVYPAAATRLSFWMHGSTDNCGSLTVQGFDGLTWRTIEIITNISKNKITKIYDSASTPALGENLTQFKFIYHRLNGPLLFDDVKVDYNIINPSFVPGCAGITVTGNSQSITGLKKNTKYFYRVRAQNSYGTSGNSNTISVITSNQPLNATAFANPIICPNTTTTITVKATGGEENYSYSLIDADGNTKQGPQDSNLFIVKEGVYKIKINDGDTSFITDPVNIKKTGPNCDTIPVIKDFVVNIFPNPAASEFTLTLKTPNSKPVQIIVTDLHGHQLYQNSGYDGGKYVFGNNFAAGIYFVTVIQDKNKIIRKLVKQSNF